MSHSPFTPSPACPGSEGRRTAKQRRYKGTSKVALIKTGLRVGVRAKLCLCFQTARKIDMFLDFCIALCFVWFDTDNGLGRWVRHVTPDSQKSQKSASRKYYKSVKCEVCWITAKHICAEFPGTSCQLVIIYFLDFFWRESWPLTPSSCQWICSSPTSNAYDPMTHVILPQFCALLCTPILSLAVLNC